jgi:hypothetical protein
MTDQFWMIEERVTENGLYITWPEIYSKKEYAEFAIKAANAETTARAVLYQTGIYSPERVE